MTFRHIAVLPEFWIYCVKLFSVALRYSGFEYMYVFVNRVILPWLYTLFLFSLSVLVAVKTQSVGSIC